MSPVDPTFRNLDLNFVRERLFPELKEIKSERERSKAMKLATKKAWKNHRLLNVFLWILILPSFALFVLVPYYLELISQDLFLYAYLALILILHAAVLLRMRRSIRLELRLMLKLDFWCRQCDYLLHQNTSGVCPECGAKIPADQKLLIADSDKLGHAIETSIVSD